MRNEDADQFLIAILVTCAFLLAVEMITWLAEKWRK